MDRRTKETLKTKQTVQQITPSVSPENASGFAFTTGALQIDKEEDNKITFILNFGSSDHVINKTELKKNIVALKISVKIYVAKNSTFIRNEERNTVSHHK